MWLLDYALHNKEHYTNAHKARAKRIKILYFALCVYLYSKVALFSHHFCVLYTFNTFADCCCCCCFRSVIRNIGLVPFHFVVFVFIPLQCYPLFWALLFVLISATILLLLLACVCVCCVCRSAWVFLFWVHFFTCSIQLFCFMTMMFWLRAAALPLLLMKSLQRTFRTVREFCFRFFCYALYSGSGEEKRQQFNILRFVFIVTIVVGRYFVNTLLRLVCALCAQLCFLLLQIVICLYFRQHYLLYDCCLLLLCPFPSSSRFSCLSTDYFQTEYFSFIRLYSLEVEMRAKWGRRQQQRQIDTEHISSNNKPISNK